MCVSVSHEFHNELPQAGQLKQQLCLLTALEAKSVRFKFLWRPLFLTSRWLISCYVFAGSTLCMCNG